MINLYVDRFIFCIVKGFLNDYFPYGKYHFKNHLIILVRHVYKWNSRNGRNVVMEIYFTICS